MAQERLPDEVVLGVCGEDEETANFLRMGMPSVVSVVGSTGRGVLGSMDAAARAASGDILCFLDDDAEPLPCWLRRMEAAFEADPRLGAFGGRDLLRDHPEMRAREPLTRRVGIFTCYGRILGNHHRGWGPSRRVDVLKGCNMSVRAEVFRRTGFEMRLRGSGAQPHWELALCLDIAACGFDVVYDPDVRVIHHVAPRHGDDQLHRSGFSESALYDLVWNEHFVIQTRSHGPRRTAHRIWSALVGSTTAPGIAQLARLCLRNDPMRIPKWNATRRAARDARKS
jgi:GT2 family glycosyltransferase